MGPENRVRWSLVGVAVCAGMVLVSAAAVWACVPLRSFVTVRPQASGPPGTPVSVVGLGFTEGDGVEIRWNGVDGPELGTAVGPDFTADVKVPDASEGLYSLIVVSRGQNGVLGATASTTFLVTGPALSDGRARAGLGPRPTTATPPGSRSSTPGFVWAVLGLVIGGTTVALVARRRSAKNA